MIKLFSILVLARLSFYLVNRIANKITKWQHDKGESTLNDEGDWEIIDPAERDDGIRVEAQLSQREKARRVFGARVHTKVSSLEKRVVRGGLLALAILVVLALLIMVPTLILALQ